MPKTEKQNNNDLTKLTERPPVVAVLGHIDHGKTSLLDYIRKTNVTAREAGGITQHIGAYEIVHSSADGKVKKITFIDTPGHEAFSKMRGRGAKVADIAILVVAADEGVKPQTLEALEQIQASGAILLVAINKIDKLEAKPERVKQQLAEKGVLLEGWGGNILNQEISAKTGKGVLELLDLIILAVEMEELKADPTVPAEGVVIEAHRDAKVGNSVTLLIKNGTLRLGKYVVSGSAMGRIKSIKNFDGQAVNEASFSSPVLITGFENLPLVGDPFQTAPDKKAAEALKKQAVAAPKTAAHAETKMEEKKILSVVLKSDAFGTKEALEQIISKLDFEPVAARIIKSEIGDISESDVLLAETSSAIIAAFKVKMPPAIAKLIDDRKVTVLKSDIIYEIADAIKKEMGNLLPLEVIKTPLGKLSVLATFKIERAKMIIGGKVSDGKIKRGAKADVKRKGELVLSGRITQLQHNKEDVDEVTLGKECGLMIAPSQPSDKRIEAGDMLEIYEETVKPQTIL